MIVCLAISILSAAEALIPGWSGKREVLMGIVIAAIEAMYSCRVLRLPRSRGISMLRYRLAEACLLGILLKLLSYVGHSWSRSWTDIGSEIMAMLWQPSTFFSGDYLILLAAAWITWIIVNRVLADFEALQDPHLSHGEPYAPRETLMSRFYCGGGLLVLFIGIPHVVAIPSLADRPSLPYTGGYHVHALLYFLLGTLMLSQVRFTSLMTGWRLQDIAVADGVGKAWTRYGLVFLVLMVMIVAVLPTHYSMGLLDTALLGLKVLVDLVRRLMELLILAVTLPLSWLLRLIGQGEGGELRPPPIPRILAPELEQRGGSSFPWEVIRALLFWLTFVAVVLYLMRSYLEDHPELLKAFKPLLFARRMVDGLAALMALLAAWSRKGLHWRPRFVSDLSQTVRTSRLGLKKKRYGWHVLSRAQSHREQVIRTYLHMLQHAAAAGIHRRHHPTPSEYAPKLHHALPEVESDIRALTELFVHVRYGSEPVDPEQAATAVTHGERVARALRQLQHGDSNGHLPLPIHGDQRNPAAQREF
jgi:hypothetical protein